MSRALNDLDPRFRPLAIEFIARCAEANVPLYIVETLRTAAQQQLNRQHGVSWVEHSKHQDGLAMDVAPYEVYQEHGTNKLQWDASDPVWLTIGRVAISLGLRWGGSWKQKDMGHVEWSE